MSQDDTPEDAGAARQKPLGDRRRELDEAARLGEALGGDPLEYVDWTAPILSEPIQVKDRCAFIPDRPGAGIAWNEEAVTRFALA